MLEKAIDLGYIDINWINTDFSLDNLRKDKNFKKFERKLVKRKRAIE